MLSEKKKWLTNHAVGTTMPNLNTSILSSLEVKLPELEIQQRIASILSSLDDKIELNQQTNEKLEAIAQAMFEERCVIKVAHTLGNWKPTKLEHICNIISGKGLKNEQFKDHGFNVIGANGRIGFTDNYLIDDEYILTGRVGTLGTFQLVYEKCWISDNVLALKMNIPSSFYFIYFWIKTIDFRNLNRGSTQPLITKTDLKNLEINFPNEKILSSFDKFVRPIFQKINYNIKENQNLVLIRNSLLPKLMKGEIEVFS